MNDLTKGIQSRGLARQVAIASKFVESEANLEKAKKAAIGEVRT